MQAKNKTFIQMYEEADTIVTEKIYISKQPLITNIDYMCNYAVQIVDILIQTAGQICKYHTCDILIHLDCCEKIISNHMNNQAMLPPDLYVFGFREDGVDDNIYIRNNINKSHNIALCYSKVLAVCIEDTQDDKFNKIISVTIKDITQNVIS